MWGIRAFSVPIEIWHVPPNLSYSPAQLHVGVQQLLGYINQWGQRLAGPLLSPHLPSPTQRYFTA